MKRGMFAVLTVLCMLASYTFAQEAPKDTVTVYLRYTEESRAWSGIQRIKQDADKIIDQRFSSLKIKLRNGFKEGAGITLKKTGKPAFTSFVEIGPVDPKQKVSPYGLAVDDTAEAERFLKKYEKDGKKAECVYVSVKSKLGELTPVYYGVVTQEVELGGTIPPEKEREKFLDEFSPRWNFAETKMWPKYGMSEIYENCRAEQAAKRSEPMTFRTLDGKKNTDGSTVIDLYLYVIEYEIKAGAGRQGPLKASQKSKVKRQKSKGKDKEQGTKKNRDKEERGQGKRQERGKARKPSQKEEKKENKEEK